MKVFLKLFVIMAIVLEFNINCHAEITNDTLKITHPNAGEIFKTRDTIKISWEGSLPIDTVTLKYKLDSRNEWITISDSATGLSYNWVIPDSISGNCLFQVQSNTFHNKLYGKGRLLSTELNPSREILACAGSTGIIYFLNVETGEIIKTMPAHNGAIKSMSWSPDGSKIVIGGLDGHLKILDYNTGKTLIVTKKNQQISVLKWSPEGSKIAAQLDETVKIYDYNLDQLYGEFYGGRSFSWNPQGTLIAKCQDWHFTVYDFQGDEVFYKRFHDDGTYSPNWNNDGSLLLFTNETGGFYFWSPDSLDIIDSFWAPCFYASRISWSSDNSKLFIWDATHLLKIVDMDLRAIIKVIPSYENHCISLFWISNDTKVLLSSDDGYIKIFDANSGLLVKEINLFNSSISSMDWKHHNSIIAAGERSGIINIWDESDNKKINSLNLRTSYNTIDWSPDNEVIATGCTDGIIKVFDIETKATIKTILGGDIIINSVKWSSDSKWLASISENNNIRLWDRINDFELSILSGHQKKVNSICWFNHESKLISGSDDGSVKIWDIEQGNAIQTFTSSGEKIKSVSISPDEKLIVSGDDLGVITVWNINDGQILSTTKAHQKGIKYIKFQQDSMIFLSYGYDNCIKIWRLNENHLDSLLIINTNNVLSIEWVPNSNDVIAIQWSNNPGKYISTTLEIIDSKNGTLKQSHRLIDESYGQDKIRISINPEGSKCVLGNLHGSIIIMNLTNFEEEQIISNPQEHLVDLAWSHDENKLVSSSLKIWETQYFSELYHKPLSSRWNRYPTVSWSKNDSLIGMSEEGGKLSIFDAESKEILNTYKFNLDNYGLNDISWNPNKFEIIISGQVFDIDSEKVVRELPGYESEVIRNDWSPDGLKIASCNKDNTVIIWDAETLEILFQIPTNNMLFNNVSWSPDNKKLACGSDKSVYIWDVETGELLHALSGHSMSINSLIWNQDGSKLASSGDDAYIRIWSLDDPNPFYISDSSITILPINSAKDEENPNLKNKIFPNPATNYIEIKTEKIVDEIELFDILGREYTFTDFSFTQNGYSLNIAHLQPGLYIVKLGDEILKFLKM